MFAILEQGLQEGRALRHVLFLDCLDEAPLPEVVQVVRPHLRVVEPVFNNAEQGEANRVKTKWV